MPPEVREYAGTGHVLSKDERKKNDIATGSEATEVVENSDQSCTSVPVADFENRREEGNTSLTSLESERAQNPKSEIRKTETGLPPPCRLAADT
ncbi:hypothetical protein [Gluconobacter albidus]|uniref:hypothetical protein n=1 Tax=Gluconobacter albidus TaxID=318683 RepID=UPI0020A18ADA|nr:hypothetical protein [Gluconobacter albidus]MCP1274162.1 hypothetical protein [Gluconobacter albidus]